MKKIYLLVCAGASLAFTGCFENIVEINLNDDGSGTVINTTDMSKLIGLSKQMGAGLDLEKTDERSIDTSFSMSELADSIPNLTAEEINIVRQGMVRFNINVKEEKFSTSVSFLFNDPAGIVMRNHLSAKILNESIKSQMGDNAIPGMEDMVGSTTFDDYFDLHFSKGKISRKINEEKYAGAVNDKYLSGLREAVSMGLPMTLTYVINLPQRAKNVEGDMVELSADKKVVTVKSGIEDFFDNPSRLEFKIEY